MFASSSGQNHSPEVDSGLYYNQSTNALNVNGDITAFSSSDKRLKNNLEKINDPLDKLNKING